MGFLDIFKPLFSGSEAQDKYGYLVYVRCNRCGEPIKTRIDLRNDLSAGDEGGFVVHKTLVGKGLCFERIQVTLEFGERRNLISEEIEGGEFITAEEYEELAGE
jgi:hypothetical protein